MVPMKNRKYLVNNATGDEKVKSLIGNQGRSFRIRNFQNFAFHHFIFSHFTNADHVIWRQRPFQDLSESLNIVAVRQTIPEICSIFVFWHFANADPYEPPKDKGHRTILFGLTFRVILFISIMLLRRTVSEIQPFKDLGFELPILTLRGHPRSKIKVNMERSYMISY